MPTGPSSQQITNSLSPTAFSRYIPGDGVLRVDNGDSLIIKIGNQVYQTGLQQLGSLYAQQLGGNAAFQASQSGATARDYGRQYLQSIGLNYDSTPQINSGQFSDLMAATSNGEGGLTSAKIPDIGTLSTLFKTPTTAGGQGPMLNTGTNTLGAPAGVQPATVGAATGVQAQPNNGGLQQINTDLQLKDGETPDQYNARISANYANLPAPGTTSSTGVTNTATAPKPTTPTGYTGTISSSNVNGGNTPNYTSATDNTNYNSLFALTAPEQQAQTAITGLQNLNTQEAGKSAFQTAQENAAGLPTLTTTQQDLQSRLFGLKNEANAIPLQIQQDFTGRGVTKAGTAPIQTSQLRNNAIQSLAISSQIDATNGLIASANDKVKRAVDAQYGPIEAQIQAAKDNLTLLINSPEYSAADKKRAQQQLDYQNQAAATIAQQKSDHEAILKTANDAAANGADAVTIQKIADAKTPLEATQALAASGFGQKNTTPKIFGTATTGYYTLDANGQVTPLGVGNGGNGTTGQSAYQVQQNSRIVDSVTNLLPQISATTAGLGGSLLRNIPGTAAYNFNAQLQTLKANIAFGALTQMREASKTGGALGQISDAEERLLSATLGALDANQSPEVLKGQLQQISDSIARWNAAVSGQTTLMPTTSTSGGNNPLGI